MTKLVLIAATLTILALQGLEVSGHGRVVVPPARGSLWRFPEYAWANPAHPPDDQEQVCGGTEVTDPYVGACGLCGDSILESRPRKHEIGGENDRGLIVGNYTAGQTIPIEIFIAVNHNGWHEFRLCPYSETGAESETCFNSHHLSFGDGRKRQPIGDSQVLTTSITLPQGVTCSRCVLQWYWFGEGSNQHYRNCMDISIR